MTRDCGWHNLFFPIQFHRSASFLLIPSLLSPCPALVSVAVMNTVAKSNSSRKAGSQGRNWSRDYGGTLLTGLLPFPVAYSACFLIQPRTTHLGWYLSPSPPGELGLPTAILIHQESVPTTCPQEVWGRHFLNLGSSFQITRLCQVDKKKKLASLSPFHFSNFRSYRYQATKASLFR